MLESFYTANMSHQQHAWFHAEYHRINKNEAVGVLFALFLGGFGIHKFYMGENGLGILYLLFSWTGIPWVIGFIECFFMPARVRAYNAARAQSLAAAIRSTPVYFATTPTNGGFLCPGCGKPANTAAIFCTHCGAAVARAV
ncbi:MAG TPA: NINE protein [Granulicella sp.]|jgi:TM2 domain-containing membrane protein YozV|nr:NINE protein [Granulicella sp.]